MDFLENTGGAPTVCAVEFPTRVITLEGKEIITRIYPHFPGLHRNYTKAIDLLEKAGGLISGQAGDASCEIYSARLLRDTVYKELKQNPCSFIKIFTPEKIEV